MFSAYFFKLFNFYQNKDLIVLNTFSLIKAHKTLLSIAVLFFFTIQPILSSVLVLAENAVVVIDIDNDTEKEGENKNKQEKELSEEKKITTHPRAHCNCIFRLIFTVQSHKLQ